MIKPKKTIMEIKEYSPPTSGRKDKLRLDFNENTMGCSPKVIEALRNIKPNDLSVYPEYNQFINKIAEYLKVKPSEVLMTNGTDEAIQVILNTFLEEGDEIVIPKPTFAIFEVNASIIGAKVKPVLYNTDLSFPTEKVLSAISENTKMVVLVNPNNPTATSIKEEDIIKIVEKAKNSIVFIDEAYYQFYGKSSKNLIEKYNNVIVTQTFSKAFGLATVRLGYIISNFQIIKTLKKVLSPYSVNGIALIAGSAALDDMEYVEKYVKCIKENKKYLIDKLNNLGIKTYPTEANFLIADFGLNCNITAKELNEKGILVRNRTKDSLLKNCIRISIGTKEQIDALSEEIKKIISKKVLIFDMDGVLVDVSRSYRYAIQKTVEFFTKTDATPEDIQAFKEKGGYNNDWDLSEAMILEKGFAVEKKKIIDKFQEFYLGGLIDNEKWLLPKEILQDISKRYRLGIVTGRPREEALYVLKKNNVENFFRVVVAMEDCEKGKPDPMGLNMAMENIGYTDAIYFGDTIDDMKTAKNAKITGIGVLPPGVDSSKLRDLLIKNGAKNVLKKIEDILEALK